MSILDHLTQQLTEKGVAEPRTVAVQRLTEYGILGTDGELTAYGRVRDAMTPEERAIDRAVRRSGRPAHEYAYNPLTNRANLRAR